MADGDPLAALRPQSPGELRDCAAGISARPDTEAPRAAAGAPERVHPGLLDRARRRVKRLVRRLQLVGDHSSVGLIAAVPLVDAGVQEVAAWAAQREAGGNAWDQLGVCASVDERAEPVVQA